MQEKVTIDKFLQVLEDQYAEEERRVSIHDLLRAWRQARGGPEPSTIQELHAVQEGWLAQHLLTDHSVANAGPLNGVHVPSDTPMAHLFNGLAEEIARLRAIVVSLGLGHLLEDPDDSE
jgi:hypothetical protein